MMKIVKMTAEHVPKIGELEKICFSDPWSEKSIESELHNPLSLWLVAVDDDRVLGYVGSQSVLGEADVMNIGVAPDFRRRHIGQMLIEQLIAFLGEDGVHCLSLEVRVSNEAAIGLYEKLGFTQVGRRPNYYRNPKEDALILRKEW